MALLEPFWGRLRALLRASLGPCGGPCKALSRRAQNGEASRDSAGVGCWEPQVPRHRRARIGGWGTALLEYFVVYYNVL